MTVELLAENEILRKKIKQYEEVWGKLKLLIRDYDEGFCNGDEAMMLVKKCIDELRR